MISTCINFVSKLIVHKSWMNIDVINNRINTKYRQMAFQSVPTNPYLESLVKQNLCKFRRLYLYSTSAVILPNSLFTNQEIWSKFWRILIKEVIAFFDLWSFLSTSKDLNWFEIKLVVPSKDVRSGILTQLTSEF